jgi:hypothetical protein
MKRERGRGKRRETERGREREMKRERATQLATIADALTPDDGAAAGGGGASPRLRSPRAEPGGAAAPAGEDSHCDGLRPAALVVVTGLTAAAATRHNGALGQVCVAAAGRGCPCPD